MTGPATTQATTTESRIAGFAPLARADARVLVLGSMPGVASLAAGQYYAHPRNAFWPLMGRLLDVDPALPYAERVDRLTRTGVAVWDVLAQCRRPGSLDANIDRASEEVNDLVLFAQAHPRLRAVCFNGGKAWSAFRRHVDADALPGLARHRLPSTSPAHAALDFAAKLAAWQIVRELLA